LTSAEEQQFIEPFLQRAATGEMATISRIKDAFEAQVHPAVHTTTIYRLLDRHGWRKMAPRATPPEATADVQAAFKKTLRQLSKPPSRHAHLMIRDQCS
jgi:transposase